VGWGRKRRWEEKTREGRTRDGRAENTRGEGECREHTHTHTHIQELRAWSTLSQLSHLELSSDFQQTLDALPGLACHLTALVRLRLPDSCLDNELMAALLNAPGLRELQVRRGFGVSGEGLWRWVEGGGERERERR
jgi:hypothetical protein